MKKNIQLSIFIIISTCGVSCTKHENHFSIKSYSASGHQLKDTGITWGANYPKGNNETCIAKLNVDPNQTEMTGDILTEQDCNKGSDAQKNSDNKKNSELIYIKINEKGEKLDPKADNWNCVLDDTSNLLWEIKNQIATSGLHSADDTFTWYSGNVKTNGGDIGDWNSEFAKCAGYIAGQPETYCNISEFVNRVNNEGWCGFKDWRTPTRQELESIVNYGKTTPSINTDYFPETRNELYWTQSPTAENNKNAWVVNFRLGYSEWQMRSNPQRVRLVRNWTSDKP
jgi:hypothetical protein